jgi:hypothetical protein
MSTGTATTMATASRRHGWRHAHSDIDGHGQRGRDVHGHVHAHDHTLRNSMGNFESVAADMAMAVVSTTAM